MQTKELKAPFDTALLDQLMGQAGMDVLLATSKHNVQYLLGGHRAMFFDYMDAMGVSRYLPVLVYPRGAPQHAFYVGHRIESGQKEVSPFWTGSDTSSWGSVELDREGGGADPAARPAGRHRRCRDVVPALQLRPDARASAARRQNRQRARSAGAAPHAQERGRADHAAGSLGTGDRVHGRGLRGLPPRHDQEAARPGAARGGNRARLDLRILPHHRWQRAEPRCLGLRHPAR